MSAANLGPRAKKRAAGSETVALVLLITLVGLGIRIVPALVASSPLNDGGLFYKMIVDLQQNRFRLPDFTTYNSLFIPFAYPPLAFYLTAFLSLLLDADILDLLRLLPPIFSAMTIPAFFLLACRLQKSAGAALLATSIFAFTPRLFGWLVMGGGVTRAPGFLFALLTLAAVLRLYETEKVQDAAPVILWGALTTLTHPEAASQTALAALLFFLFLSRTRRGFLLSAGVAVGIIVLAAPWWLTVVTRHGLAPVWAAAGAASQDSPSLPARLAVLFQFLVTDEPYVALAAALGMIGLFVALARRQYLLPAWALTAFLVEPRGAGLYVALVAALLGGSALDSLILPGLHRLSLSGSRPDDSADWRTYIGRSRAAGAALGFTLVYLIAAGYATTQRIASRFTLQVPDRQAMDWVRARTPADSRFITITRGEAMFDPTTEWFPALTGRQNLNTVFGLEWISDSQFRRRLEQYRALQECAGRNLACLEAWSAQNKMDFAFVYLRNDIGNPAEQYPLTVELKFSPRYRLVYESKEVLIFQKTSP